MKGLNFGVDFEGGRSYVVRFDKPIPTVQVIDALKGPFVKAPEVKTFGLQVRWKSQLPIWLMMRL